MTTRKELAERLEAWSHDERLGCGMLLQLAAAALLEADAEIARVRAEEWCTLIDAPCDGTEIEILVRHQNWQWCKSEEERAKWQMACPASWTTHNGGGWTWRGIAGAVLAWRPIRARGETNG